MALGRNSHHHAELAHRPPRTQAIATLLGRDVVIQITVVDPDHPFAGGTAQELRYHPERVLVHEDGRPGWLDEGAPVPVKPLVCEHPNLPTFNVLAEFTKKGVVFSLLLRERTDQDAGNAVPPAGAENASWPSHMHRNSQFVRCPNCFAHQPASAACVCCIGPLMGHGLGGLLPHVAPTAAQTPDEGTTSGAAATTDHDRTPASAAAPSPPTVDYTTTRPAVRASSFEASRAGDSGVDNGEAAMNSPGTPRGDQGHAATDTGACISTQDRIDAVIVGPRAALEHNRDDGDDSSVRRD